MRIAISTGGGDAPGLNAVIRAAVLSAVNRGWDVLGIKRGYAGLLGEDEVATFRCRYRIKSTERQRLEIALPRGIVPLSHADTAGAAAYVAEQGDPSLAAKLWPELEGRLTNLFAVDRRTLTVIERYGDDNVAAHSFRYALAKALADEGRYAEGLRMVDGLNVASLTAGDSTPGWEQRLRALRDDLWSNHMLPLPPSG